MHNSKNTNLGLKITINMNLDEKSDFGWRDG